MTPERGSVGAWVGQYGTRPIGEVGDGVAALEEAGYATIWYSEALGREALSFGAILLSATTTATVASGIANIWARDATAMRNGARTLAEGFDGRFLLGIGVSHGPLVDRRGHAYHGPYRAMVDYLDAMDHAPSRVPDPPTEPPVVLAALGPKMLRLAAERAAGAHPYFVPVEHTVFARQVMGDGPWLAPEQAAVLADDAETARAVARDHIRHYVALPNYRNNLLRMGWSENEVDGMATPFVDAVVAWGDEEAVAQRVRAHHEAGADHVSLQLLPTEGSGVPVADYLRVASALSLA